MSKENYVVGTVCQATAPTKFNYATSRCRSHMVFSKSWHEYRVEDRSGNTLYYYRIMEGKQPALYFLCRKPICPEEMRYPSCSWNETDLTMLMVELPKFAQSDIEEVELLPQ
jgi:hypothetical protein